MQGLKSSDSMRAFLQRGIKMGCLGKSFRLVDGKIRASFKPITSRTNDEAVPIDLKECCKLSIKKLAAQGWNLVITDFDGESDYIAAQIGEL